MTVVTALDGHVERRPKTTRVSVAMQVGRWLVRLVVLVLVADVVRILVTSKTIEWGQVGHYLSVQRDPRRGRGNALLTVCGMAIGIVLGVVLALMRLSSSFVMNGASSLYLWFFRGTPLLVQILFLYNLASFIPRITIGIPFGGPTFLSWDTNSLITALAAGIFALGLNQAAYMCEIVRAGILSVDEGQLEASLALGMTPRACDAEDRAPAGDAGDHPADRQQRDRAAQGLEPRQRDRRQGAALPDTAHLCG